MTIAWPFRGIYGDNYTKITSDTTEREIVPAYSEKHVNLRKLIITNTSATACKVTLRDQLAGNVRGVFDIPTRATVHIDFEAGEPGASMEQSTVGTRWTLQCTTSVDSIEVLALFKNS